MQAQPDITFRVVSKQDIPVIQELSSRIWREHYPGIISPGQIDYMLGKMYAADVIRGEIANRGYRYVIVLQGDQAVGYIAYRSDAADQAIMISKLYLLPSLHGKGIGGRMLGYVKDDAVRRDAKRIYLYVNKNNVKAIKAYERFGMRKAEEIVTDIGAGYVMDDYRMEILL